MLGSPQAFLTSLWEPIDQPQHCLTPVKEKASPSTLCQNCWIQFKLRQLVFHLISSLHRRLQPRSGHCMSRFKKLEVSYKRKRTLLPSCSLHYEHFHGLKHLLVRTKTDRSGKSKVVTTKSFSFLRMLSLSVEQIQAELQQNSNTISKGGNGQDLPILPHLNKVCMSFHWSFFEGVWGLCHAAPSFICVVYSSFPKKQCVRFVTLK